VIFDSHIHSAASPDSETPPEEVIAILNKKGLGCTFTEHIEYSADLKPFFCVDFDVYPKEYVKYKSDSVALGVELSLIPQAIDINRQHAANLDLDFIMGSIHVVDGIDLGANADITKKWFSKWGEEAYLHFFKDSLEMIQANDFFDSFGHIDYISRYSTLPEENVLYDKYTKQYDELLKALIERDKVLEFCTRRIADESACENLYKIYTRYKELGGCYVTIGSDAHIADQLGYKFDLALDVLNEIGLTPVYFKNRRMVLS